MRLVAMSVVVLLVATGCQPFTAGYQSAVHSRDLMKVQVGMTRDELVALMGPPEKREAYGDTEFLIYRTDYTGTSEVQNFTPFAIVDGKVVGWGRNYYAQVTTPRHRGGPPMGTRMPDLTPGSR